MEANTNVVHCNTRGKLGVYNTHGRIGFYMHRVKTCVTLYMHINSTYLLRINPVLE